MPASPSLCTRPHGLPLRCWIFAALLLLGFACNGARGLNDEEISALESLLKTWPRLANISQPWSDDYADACTKFHGITCSAESHITGLNLTGLDLGGSGIPDAIGSLSYLEVLDLSSNGLSDPASGSASFPTWLSTLPLRNLNLENNPMGDEIPSSLCNNIRLKVLRLAGMNYTNTIPFCISRMSWLEEVSFGSPRLFGWNFSDVSKMRELRSWKLVNCPQNANLTFPAGFELLPALTHFYVSNVSLLFGIPPFSTHTLETLVIKGLAVNIPTLESIPSLLKHNFSQLSLSTINIPESIYNCGNLRVLDLSHNAFFSYISKNIQNLKKLTTLNLGFNIIRGTLPAEIAKLPNLTELRLRRAFLLSGTVPEPIWSMKQLQVLDLSGNFLHGTISRKLNLPNLRELHLADLFLKGTVPASLFNSKKLTHLDLSQNGFYISSVDEFICSTIKSHFDTTGFCGRVLDIVSQLESLTYLDLAGNMFGGSINDSVPPTLTNLTHFDISDNFFVGSIPTNVHLMEKLEWLHLSDNFLTGTIPPSVSLMQNLTFLGLGSNLLNGNLPDEIGNLTRLKWLEISNSAGILGVDCDVNPMEIPRNRDSSYYTVSVDGVETNGEPSWDDCGFLDFSIPSSGVSNGITGTMPSLLSLSGLVHLDLGGNSLNQSIASILDRLPTLIEDLLLNRNILDGWTSLRPIASHLPHLLRLDLSENGFEGSIDFSDFAEAWHLRELRLHSNNLEGTLPVGCILPKLPVLEVLDLHSNLLVGNLSLSSGGLGGIDSTLTFLDVSSNQLGPSLTITRYFPFSWSPPRHLDVRRNRFSGSLPRLLTPMAFFAASENQFSGEIPTDLIPSTLSELRLNSNNLTGKIPPFPYQPDMETCWIWLAWAWISKTTGLPGELENFLCGNRLAHLDLSHNSLTGTPPASFSLLPNLYYLNLSRNDLHGEILDSLANAWALNTLDLEFNRLSGTFPAFVHVHHTISSLNRGINEETGATDAEDKPVTQPFGFLMSWLDLSNNDFSGTFPDISNEQFPYMGVLDVNTNNFEGAPLAGLCSVLHNGLQILDLRNNGFYGKFPACDSPAEGLWHLDLSFNDFEGSIPPYVVSSPSLRYLNLFDNYFSGSIPETLYDLKNLETLNLADNDLEGTLNDEIGNLVTLTNLDLRFNKLRGTIPDTVSNLVLQDVLFSFNEFEGKVPTGLWPYGENCTYDISNNMLQSTLPDLSQLKCIKVIVANNQLFGTIPPITRRVQRLVLSGNRFNGTIPVDWIGDSPNAVYFNGNLLDGSIPEELMSLAPTLHVLDVSHNELSGTIPNFGIPPSSGLAETQTLRFDHNNFTGSLPDIPMPIAAVSLTFASNHLIGVIPTSWMRSLDNLLSLDLSNNHLEGHLLDLPAGLRILDISNNNFTFNLSLFESPNFDSFIASNNRIFGNLTLDNFPSIRKLVLTGNELGGSISFAAVQFAFRRNLYFLDILKNEDLVPWKALPEGMSISEGMNPTRLENTTCRELEAGFSDTRFWYFEYSLLSYIPCSCSEGYYGTPPHCALCPVGLTCTGPEVEVPSGTYVYELITRLPPSISDPIELACERKLCISPCFLDAWTGKSACEPSLPNAKNSLVFGPCNHHPVTSSCSKGTTGRLCTRCTCESDTDCYYSTGNSCFRCDSSYLGKLPTAVWSLVVFVLLLGTILAYISMISTHAMAEEEAESSRSSKRVVRRSLPIWLRLVTRIRAVLPTGMLLIILNFWQTLSIIFPDSISGITFLRLLNGRLGASGFVCLSPTLLHSPTIKFLVQVLIPILLAILIGIGILVARAIRAAMKCRSSNLTESDLPLLEDDDVINTTKPKTKKSNGTACFNPRSAVDRAETMDFWNILIQWPLAVIRVFYLGVAYTSFQYLFYRSDKSCDAQDYVVAHPWMKWNDPEAFNLRMLSIPFIILLLLFPMIIVALIVKRRKCRCNPSRSSEQNSRLPIPLESMTSLFRPAVAWWEVVLLVRKLLVAAIFRGLRLNSGLLTVLFVTTCCILLVAQLIMRPWRSKTDNIAESIFYCLMSLCAITISAGNMGLRHSKSISIAIAVLSLVTTAAFLGYSVFTTARKNIRSSLRVQTWQDKTLPSTSSAFML